MAVCVICLDTLKLPMALPCGHVYCHECILSKIESDATNSTIHCCSLCRKSYSIANVDPNAVPGHLRNSVLPALRRIYLDEIQDAPPPPAETEAEVSKLRAENTILHAYCGMWKHRANFHSAIIYGVAKAARGQILGMRAEQEQLERKYESLKRKYADLEASASPSPASADDRLAKLNDEKRSGPDSGGPSDSESWTSSPVAPPMKKLRSSTRSPGVKFEPTN